MTDRAVFEQQDIGFGHSPRGRARASVEDSTLTDVLWRIVREPAGRAEDWFPSDPPLEEWRFTRCHPRTQLYRYGLGGAFPLHRDEPGTPAPFERSMLTVVVYLPAGGCLGRETVVDGEVIQVAGRRIAVFDHRLHPEGKPVERAHKLVLRNDVAATRRPRIRHAVLTPEGSQHHCATPGSVRSSRSSGRRTCCGRAAVGSEG